MGGLGLKLVGFRDIIAGQYPNNGDSNAKQDVGGEGVIGIIIKIMVLDFCILVL